MNSRVMLVAIAAVLVACAGSARITYAAPPANACSLLTPAQVSAVVGAPVGAGTPFSPTNTKACRWLAIGAAVKIQVQLFLKDARTFAYTKMLTHGVVASGIGDDAIYSTAPRGPSILSVKKGDAVFDVHVLSYGLADDKVKTMERTLALNVLAKL